jgi:hypothetical protein
VVFGEASVDAIGPEADEGEQAGLPPSYWQACRLAEQGQYDEARRIYSELTGRLIASIDPLLNRYST